MIVEDNILDGQQLINLRSRENRDLPVVGQKEFQPTNSWLEKKFIQSSLADRKALLQEQRVEKSNALASAEWIPDKKKAKVTKRVGKLWENFGHHVDDADWLFPEEALFLLETNTLELVLDEIPLSIERSYITLLSKETGCTLNEYRAFSHLARLGYRLFRHLAEVSVTRYEKDINLHQHVLKQKRTYNSNVSDNDSTIVEIDITDKSNDRNDVCRGGFTRELDHSNVSCDVTFEQAEHSVEKQRSPDAPLLQDKERATEVIQIEPEESLNSCDVLSVNGKTPTSKANVATVREDICIDDDDDDVIEIPIDKEIVIVNDVSDDDNEANKGSGHESAASCDDDEDDDSSIVSERSASNWKRRSNESDNIIDILESPPPSRYAVRTTYMTVNEFLFDPLQSSIEKSNSNNVKDDEVIELSDDETTTRQDNMLGKEIERFYKEIEVIDIESEPEDTVNSLNKNNSVVKLSKQEILDLFPNLKNGTVNVLTIPSANFLPPNVKPSCKEYRLTFNTSDFDNSNDRIRNRNNFYRSSNISNNFNNCINSNYNSNRSNSYNNNNSNLFYVRHAASKGGNQFPFQRSNNRSSFYYNQNRPRFNDNPNNPLWSQPWQVNSLQNQVTQLRDMATGMLHVASSLLSLPFVQQSFPNIPSLFGVNQSFQQSAPRMPALYESTQPYQNQLNPRIQQQAYGPISQMFDNPSLLLNQQNNMISYNSTSRQQYNTVHNEYSNSNSFNVDSNFRNNNYSHRASNNYVQTFNDRNDCRSPQPNVTTNSNACDNSCNNINEQNMNRKRPRWSDNYSDSNNCTTTRINADNCNENNTSWEGNSNTANHSEESSRTQIESRINEVNDSTDSRGRRRSNSRARRRAKRRYFVDNLPEFSVFNNDIEVSDAALGVDSMANKDDFIPFSASDSNDRDDNRNFRDDRIRNDHPGSNRFEDVNRVNYMDSGNNSFDNRNTRRYRSYFYNNHQSINRGRQFPRYNYNRRPIWRKNFNTPNKRQRFDMESSGNTSNQESRNIFNDSRNVPNESRNILVDEPANLSSELRDQLDESRSDFLSDSIEIIEDLSGNDTARSKIEHKKQIAAQRNRHLEETMRRMDSGDTKGKRKQRKRFRRHLKKKAKMNNEIRPIEVIDIDIDEHPASVKAENPDKQTDIKVEKNKQIDSVNKDSRTSNATLVKREGVDDETSVNSVFSNSCISTNSNNSSVIKSEPCTSTVKRESTVVKQETSSIAITTSVSSLSASATETTVMTTTTATVISVKLEENAAVKTEKSNESDKDITVTITENVTNDSVSIKTEKANDVAQTLVKREKSTDQIQSQIPVDIKVENSNNTEEVTVSNVCTSIAAEKIVNENETSVRLTSERQNDKEITVLTDSSDNIETSQIRSVEAEVFSWAQLKQKSSVTVTPVVDDSHISVESLDEEDDDDDVDDDDEVSEEEEDEERIQPIIKAEDCKSMRTVLSALQIIGSADLAPSSARKLKISYDVYIPNVPLKKSSRGLPNYRLVIMSFRDDVPTPGEMAELSSRFEDGVPILIAVVSYDSVSFFAASTVRLPIDDGS